jgi:ribosomal protein S25
MAENKKSFTAYCDWNTTFNSLPDDKAGQLIKHLFAYVNDENPETDDLLINAVFANIKATLKRDLKKWEEKSKKNQEIAFKRWQTKVIESIENDANAYEGIKTDANYADSVSVSVSVSDSVNDNVKEKRVVNKFTAPTLLEVQTYFTENGYTNELGKKAFDYYSVANWKDSKGNQVKNWKQKMRGVWFKDENKEQQFSKNFQSPFKPIAL